MKKKKIAVIAHGLSGGGAERVAATLANYLFEQGHTVLFVAAYSGVKEYELSEKIQYCFIKTRALSGTLRMIDRSIKIQHVVRQFGADVVFSFITNELIPLEFSGIPVIPSLRIDPKSTDSSFVRRNIRKFVYHHAKKIVFQTQEARDYFDAAIREKGVVIGNPLKTNLPVWNSEKHRKVFMTACRITEQKNIPMLIDAFVLFHKKHPEYTLEIYGDAETKSYQLKMEQHVKNCAAEEYITFKGHSTEIHSIMCDSEVFVLSSDYEGLSNSMLEAMAIGIPCICTDCPPGGAREYMKNGEAGCLVPVGDVVALAEKMCYLADDEEREKAVSKKEQYVRELLRRDNVCARWEALIE